MGSLCCSSTRDTHHNLQEAIQLSAAIRELGDNTQIYSLKPIKRDRFIINKNSTKSRGYIPPRMAYHREFLSRSLDFKISNLYRKKQVG